MKIKKRLKYKSTLPKADYSMDPNALSNMNKQAAEETPAQGGGMGAAGAMGMATQGLNLVSSFMPKDNDDGIGVSHKGSAISKGISGGLKAGADMARAVPGFGTIAAAAMDAGAAITDMVTGWVDKVREKDRTKVSRSARLAYDPTNNNTGYSFGTPQVPTSQPMFGGQAKYGMPLFGDGGSMKYNTNFRPATSYEQKYNKETGLWEVSGAKPKQTTTTKKTVPQKVTPIYTSDPNDKRLQAYNDSSALYKKTQDINNPKYYENGNPSWYTWKGTREEAEAFSIKNNIDYKYTGEFPGKIKPISTQDWGEGMNAPIYKKPVQPVIFKPVPRAGNINIRSESLEGFKNGGEPIYTSDPNDKRLQAYNDSTTSYITALKTEKDIKEYFNKNIKPKIVDKENRIAGANPFSNTPMAKSKADAHTIKDNYEDFIEKALESYYEKAPYNPDIAGTQVGFLHYPPTYSGYGSRLNPFNYNNSTIINSKSVSFPKPKQPVIYKEQQTDAQETPLTSDQKPEVKVPVPKKNFNNLKEKQNILGNNIQYQNEPVQEELKGKPLNDFLKQERKNPNGGVNTYIRKDTKSPWLQQDFALGGEVENSLNKQASRFEPIITTQQKTKNGNTVTKDSSLINSPLFKSFAVPLGNYASSPIDYQKQLDLFKKYGTFDGVELEKLMNSNQQNTDVVKHELGGDPRAQSNIEAEQGEAMQHSSGKIEAIGGKKHPNGGTPLIVQPSHEYIYSDSLGKDKNGNITLNEKDVVRSFADDAKAIQKKYSKREGDSIVDKTKEIELGLLKQDAERARVAKEEIEMGKQMKKYKAKYGADLKKFANSGYTQYGVIPSGKQPSQEDDILTIQKRMLQADPNALPKYGADGSWGTESQTAFDKLSPQIGGAPQFTFNTNSSTIPLFGGGVNPNPFIGPKPFNPSRRDNLHEAANFYTPGQVGTPRMATPSMNQRSTPAEVADKVKNGMFDSLTTGDKMQLASMLPAFGFNMGMGLRKADVEPNRKNLYEKDVVNIMQNRKFDIQNYLNQSNLATNTAKEDIGNNSTSVGGKMANLQKLFANQSNALGDITTKGQEMNNQYRAEEANTKNIIGEANRAESIRAAGINDQNKARKQQFLAKAFEQMGQGIATTGQSANQSLTNKLLIKSLSEISPDFDVKNMKDLQVGDDGYIVFKGVKTEFKMSDEGKIVMAGGTPNTANAAKSQYAPKDFAMKAFANFTKTKTK